MTLDTKRHIESMLQTSLALEDHIRASGGYSKDCARINDAIVRGKKSGVALLWDAAGRMEIVDLNGGSKHCAVKETDGNGVVVEHDFPTWKNEPRSEQRKEESHAIVKEAAETYEQVAGENWEKGVVRSHEHGNKVAGHFPPVVHTGAKVSTADAARLRQMSADARKFSQSQYARNAAIAQQMKLRSAQIHK